MQRHVSGHERLVVTTTTTTIISSVSGSSASNRLQNLIQPHTGAGTSSGRIKCILPVATQNALFVGGQSILGEHTVAPVTLLLLLLLLLLTTGGIGS